MLDTSRALPGPKASTPLLVSTGLYPAIVLATVGWTSGEQHSRSGGCFQIAGSQRGKRLTCSTPHPPFLLSTRVLPPVRWPEVPQGVLTLALDTFPGGAGRERELRELPFLEPSSVPSPRLATSHPLPRGILPVPLQCPDDTGLQMRKERLRPVP